MIRNYDANVPLLHVLVDSFNPEKIWVIEDHHLVLRAGKPQGPYLKATIIGSLHHDLSNIVTANKVNVTQLLHLSPLKTIPTWSYLDQEYREFNCDASTRHVAKPPIFGSYLRQVKPPIFCSKSSQPKSLGGGAETLGPGPRCHGFFDIYSHAIPMIFHANDLWIDWENIGHLGLLMSRESDLDDLGVPPWLLVDLSHPSRHNLLAEKDLKDLWLTNIYIYIYLSIYLSIYLYL